MEPSLNLTGVVTLISVISIGMMIRKYYYRKKQSDVPPPPAQLKLKALNIDGESIGSVVRARLKEIDELLASKDESVRVRKLSDGEPPLS